MASWLKWFSFGRKNTSSAGNGGRPTSQPTPSVLSPRSGELVWFEVQECPHEFRFAILPNQPLLFGCRPESGGEVRTWLLPPGQDAALVRRLRESLSRLIESHQVFPTMPQSPANAFANSAMTVPSFHLRLAFAPNKAWQSCYETNNVPANILAFYNDVKALGLREIASQPGQDVPPERAAEMVKVMSSTNVGKVKFAADCQLYFNQKLVSLEELKGELAKLAAANGTIWYFRENTVEAMSESKEAAVKAVMDAIAECRLPVRLCPTDFD